MHKTKSFIRRMRSIWRITSIPISKKYTIAFLHVSCIGTVHYLSIILVLFYLWCIALLISNFISKMIVLDFRCLLIVDISWIKIFLSIRFSRYNVKLFLDEWRWRDSNSWPPACKAGALPTELHPHLIRQPPILPYRCQYSTFGRLGLNRRVRDGNGCYPKTHRHRKFLVVFVRAADHSLTATDLRRLLLGHALIQILSAVCISEQAHMHTSVKISALTLTTR